MLRPLNWKIHGSEGFVIKKGGGTMFFGVEMKLGSLDLTGVLARISVYRNRKFKAGERHQQHTTLHLFTTGQ